MMFPVQRLVVYWPRALRVSCTLYSVGTVVQCRGYSSGAALNSGQLSPVSGDNMIVNIVTLGNIILHPPSSLYFYTGRHFIVVSQVLLMWLVIFMSLASWALIVCDKCDIFPRWLWPLVRWQVSVSLYKLTEWADVCSSAPLYLINLSCSVSVRAVILSVISFFSLHWSVSTIPALTRTIRSPTWTWMCI